MTGRKSLQPAQGKSGNASRDTIIEEEEDEEDVSNKNEDLLS